MTLLAKIGLGTVQWGMPYGIANRGGRPARAQVSAMLELARAKGVTLLDTAPTYGDAEHILGDLDAGAGGFRIITKTPPQRTSVLTLANARAVAEAFDQSLHRLRATRVDGLLVHEAVDLLGSGGERLWRVLETTRSEGRASRIGVSVYHPAQLRQVMEAFPIDVVQLPFNIYDQRFVREGALLDAKRRGVEVHARSAFLQGLLLLPPDKLPAHFAPWRPHHERLYRRMAEGGAEPLATALCFSLQQTMIDRVIVGCEDPSQLEQILCVAEQAAGAVPELGEFAVDSLDLIDPSRWPR